MHPSPLYYLRGSGTLILDKNVCFFLFFFLPGGIPLSVSYSHYFFYRPTGLLLVGVSVCLSRRGPPRQVMYVSGNYCMESGGGNQDSDIDGENLYTKTPLRESALEPLFLVHSVVSCGVRVMYVRFRSCLAWYSTESAATCSTYLGR